MIILYSELGCNFEIEWTCFFLGFPWSARKLWGETCASLTLLVASTHVNNKMVTVMSEEDRYEKDRLKDELKQEQQMK